MKLRVIAALMVAACSQPPSRAPLARGAAAKKPGSVTISIVGTNDLHGALGRLPILAGYIANLRAARAADGGGVVLLDAGDMFQGTLESNLTEGLDVVHAYNAMGYHAVAVGNHEFDFGPEGAASTPIEEDDDARGALKARAKEAKFPFLTANILDQKSGSRISWPNMPPSVLIEVAGTKLGIIGVSTEATPFTTMPANFVGLKMAPVADTIVEQARHLRGKGARVIIVTAHLGTRCTDFTRASDASSCDSKEELARVIKDLPGGTIDVIVAGHTHAAIAHRIDGIAVIESYASGKAFGRVDLRIAPEGHVTATRIFKPKLLCDADVDNERDGATPVPVKDCRPSEYEGRPVVPDPAVQKIVDVALERAQSRRDESLRANLIAPVTKAYATESAVGNWLTDLMLEAMPQAKVSVTNGGGLRADLPAGELTYGELYEAIPFDNRFALVDLEGLHLRKLVTSNLQRGGGILSWGGLTAVARCRGERLDVTITVGGKPLDDRAPYKLVTSDFLASGSEGLIGRLKLRAGSVRVTDIVIREAIAKLLRAKPVIIDPAKLMSPKHKRLDYPGERPIECARPAPQDRDKEPPE